MKVSEIREKSEKELKELLDKTRKDLQKLVSDVLQKKEKNVTKARLFKKDIARIQTIINEKKKLNQESK